MKNHIIKILIFSALLMLSLTAYGCAVYDSGGYYGYSDGYYYDTSPGYIYRFDGSDHDFHHHGFHHGRRDFDEGGHDRGSFHHHESREDH